MTTTTKNRREKIPIPSNHHPCLPPSFSHTLHGLRTHRNTNSPVGYSLVFSCSSSSSKSRMSKPASSSPLLPSPRSPSPTSVGNLDTEPSSPETTTSSSFSEISSSYPETSAAVALGVVVVVVAVVGELRDGEEVMCRSPKP